jgi:hypothetical protein
MEQQSFRTQLVEWIKEIIPYSNFDKYVRRTREGFLVDPPTNQPNAAKGVNYGNNVAYLICTEENSYSISATPSYLGCVASARRCRAGEDGTRGNDLPDGKFCRETWEAIKNRIIGYELVKLETTNHIVLNGGNAIVTAEPLPFNPFDESTDEN